MMRKTVLLFVLLVVALSPVGCKPKASRHAATELRIATQPAPIYSPIFVVKSNRWLEQELEKEGVTVRWSSFVAGPPENESFFAGQQDVGVIGDTPALVARSAGLDTRVVGISAVGPKALAIVARADSSIRTPADLRGRRIGVSKGTYAHHLLFLVLQKAGLKPTDITLTHLPPPDLVTAFNRGDVEAAATWEPFLSRIETNDARRIADGSGIKLGVLLIFATHEFATKNPRLVESVLKAYQRGYEYIQSNPKEAAALIAPEVKLEPAQVERLLPLFNFDPRITSEHVKELKTTEEFLHANGLSKAPVDVDGFFDSRYLQSAGLLQ